jgi:hypothetical protein
MYALMVVMLAAIPAGGDDQDRISTKTAQLLGVEGTWEGTYQYEHGRQENIILIAKRFREASMNEGKRTAIDENGLLWIDEGNGKLRIFDTTFNYLAYHGIYQREAGRLIVCIRSPKFLCPVTFRIDENTRLFILNRQEKARLRQAKPGKGEEM